MMVHDETDLRLIEAIQDGLPLVPRPYARVGQQIGLAEDEVIRRIGQLRERGIIRRLGVVVRHRKLGIRANAMVVWDIPDERIAELAPLIASQDGVNLCYRRPRRPPEWPYNLFSMIHGRDRAAVLSVLDGIVQRCGLQDIPRQVLFSRRCFKQQGAHYRLTQPPRPLLAANG
jgi:DNA-binding Lrp family transcriptional regulator